MGAADPAPRAQPRRLRGRVKHLRKRSAAAIVEARAQHGEFASVEELTRRVRLASRELRALILSGACDGLAELPVEDYPFAHRDLLRARGLTTAAERPRPPAPGADPRQLARYRALVRVRHELELLDMHVSAHPLRVLRAEARRYGCLRLAQIQAEAAPGRVLRFAGLLAASRRHRTQAGAVVNFMTFEDETGLLDALVSTRDYPRLAPILTTPGPYLGEGRLRDELGHRHVEITTLLPFFERRRLTPRRSSLDSWK